MGAQITGLFHPECPRMNYLAIFGKLSRAAVVHITKQVEQPSE